MDCEDPPFRWGWRGLSCVHDIQRGLHDDASDKDIFSTFDNTSRYIIIHETVMHSWNNVRVENGIIELIEQTNTLCNRSIHQTSYTAAQLLRIPR